MDDNMTSGVLSDRSVRLILSPSITAKSTFFYVYRTGYLEIQSMRTYEMMGPDCFFLAFVVSGKGKLTYNGKEYVLIAGDLFFVDSFKSHSYYATEQKSFRILYLFFDGKHARGYYNMISNKKNPIYRMKSIVITKSFLWQIVTLHKNKNIRAELLSALHITRILTEIIMLSQNSILPKVNFPSFIHQIYNHIDNYYKEKITIDMLAELYFVNKYHLEREFKRCSGVTINEYVTEVRIEKAKELLHYTDKLVREIAEEVGFFNSSHFIKTFHKREQITPLAYRKQWTR